MKKIITISLILSSLFANTINLESTTSNNNKMKKHTLHDIKNILTNNNSIDLNYNNKNLIISFFKISPSEFSSSLSNLKELSNKSYNIKYLKSLSNYNTNIAILNVSQNVNILKLLEELKRKPFIKNISLDYKREMKYIPNDKLFDRQWSLNSNKDKDINIIKIWDKYTGNKDIVVAVLDTGESLLHEDLKKNLWVNEKELNGKPGVDDDNDGYVDDIYGYDFAADLNGGNAPLTGAIHSHGAHVSGIIGAVGDNGIGVSGINMKVTILPVKIFRPNLYAYDSDILEAIDYVLALKQKKGLNIVAINASYGGFGGSADNSPMKDAIKKLGDNGIVFFAAAGNSDYNNDELYYDNAALPASYNLNNIVSVAASGYDGNLTYFSQYGEKTVQVAAPGWDILSTIDAIDGNETGNEDFFDNFDSNRTNWSTNGNWNITDVDYYSPTHSITDSPNGNYDDSKTTYIYSEEIKLAKEENNTIALNFCMNNKLADGDILYLYYYDSKTDEFRKIDRYKSTTNWKCIGLPIPNYYKTDKFRVLFALAPNNDGQTDDGVYLDDIKIGDYNKTNAYASWAGTSMATPEVVGAYALFTSINPNESMYSKISRIIGNGEKLNNNIMGVNLNIGDIVNQPSKPLIFNTKKVMHVDNEAVFDVNNAGSNPKVYIGDKKVDVISNNNGQITIKVSNDAQNYIVVQNGDLNSSNKLYISKWQMLTNIPGEQNSHKLGNKVIYKDKIYVLNGFDINDNINDKIDIFDLNTKQWSEAKNTNPNVLHFATSQVYNGKIYMFAGIDENNNYNDSVIIYDIENDMFSNGTNLPIKGIYVKSVLVGDKIYLIGGEDENSNTLDTIYEYDIKNDKFIKKASLPRKVSLAGVCLFNNKIYIFGGFSDSEGILSHSYEYDIKTDKCKEIANLPKSSEGLACVNIDNKFIAIISGFDGKNYSNLMLEYNPNTDKYEEINNSVLNNILSRADITDSILEYNDSLYYVGGFNEYVYETKTIETIKKEAFILKEEANKTISNLTASGNGKSGLLPAFNLIALLIMLGGSLFIIRRKV